MQKLKLFAIFILLCLLSIIPANVSASCTCEAEEETSDKAGALKYKIAAIPSVLLAGVVGVLFPLLGNIFPALRPETTFFFLTKAFAAGVILATGFIHVLPEASEMLTSPCLSEDPWGKFPFTGFIAMTAAILTLSVDSFATSFFHKAHSKMKIGYSGGVGEEGQQELGPHVEAHGHAHGIVPAGSDEFSGQTKNQLLRHRVVAQVLEVGIIVHSVVIGISLGASQNPDTAKTLFVALMFHQCFEGLGLGSCITQGKFKCASVTIMTLFFSLTTPVGIGVGMGISNVYSETSPTALIVQGVLNSASAGILIYMSLVDLLAQDFMHPKIQSNTGLQVMAHLSLLLGAGLMSLLAKWA